MNIYLNTDNHIQATDNLRTEVDETLTQILGRFEDRLTRLEVHLADVDGSKKHGEADKRCTLESRPAGLKPLTVTAEGPNLTQAVRAAAEKLKSALESALGKLSNQKGSVSMAGPQ